MLRPQSAFLPKVVPLFHLNQDIVLPSLCPNPKHPKKKVFHSLDVVQTVPVYQVYCFLVDSLIPRLFCPRVLPKDRLLFNPLFVGGIYQLIFQAYGLKVKVPPFLVKAFFTRRVSAS